MERTYQRGTAIARNAKIAKDRRNWKILPMKTLPLIPLMTLICAD
jgi:hypothetical protein